MMTQIDSNKETKTFHIMQGTELPVTLKDGILTSDLPAPEHLANPSKLIYLPETVFDLTRNELKEKGDREILVNCDLALRGIDQDNISKRSLLLSTIEPTSASISRFLYHHGLRANDFIHILIPNTTEYYYPVLGAYMCNANVSVADPTMTIPVITGQLIDTEAKFVFCFTGNLGNVKQAVSDSGLLQCKIIIMDFDFVDVDPNNNIYSFMDAIKEAEGMADVPNNIFDTKYDENCLLVWSSGTTGRPKGIPFHRKTFSRITDSSMGSSNVLLQTTCFFHGGGFVVPLGRLMHKKMTYFFPVESLFENGGLKLLKAIDRFKASVLVTGSHHLMEAAALPVIPENLDLGSVLKAMPIGTSVPVEMEKKLKTIFPKMPHILNLYGSTESGTLVTTSTTLAYLGRLLPGMSMKIVNPDTGKICGVNEIGEMRVKGYWTLKAYFKRPEESKDLYDEEGFLKMGDLGCFDENKIIYFHGRIKEIIKYRNNHLSPIEVENVLVKHPKVKDVAVFAQPDPLAQELVTALVVKKENNLVEEELVKMVADNLEDFKHLRGGVIFVDSIPRNHQGKILRRSLKEFAEQILNEK